MFVPRERFYSFEGRRKAWARENTQRELMAEREEEEGKRGVGGKLPSLFRQKTSGTSPLSRKGSFAMNRTVELQQITLWTTSSYCLPQPPSRRFSFGSSPPLFPPFSGFSFHNSPIKAQTIKGKLDTSRVTERLCGWALATRRALARVAPRQYCINIAAIKT